MIIYAESGVDLPLIFSHGTLLDHPGEREAKKEHRGKDFYQSQLEGF